MEFNFLAVIKLVFLVLLGKKSGPAVKKVFGFFESAFSEEEEEDEEEGFSLNKKSIVKSIVTLFIGAGLTTCVGFYKAHSGTASETADTVQVAQHDLENTVPIALGNTPELNNNEQQGNNNTSTEIILKSDLASGPLQIHIPIKPNTSLEIISGNIPGSDLPEKEKNQMASGNKHLKIQVIEDAQSRQTRILIDESVIE